MSSPNELGRTRTFFAALSLALCGCNISDLHYPGTSSKSKNRRTFLKQSGAARLSGGCCRPTRKRRLASLPLISPAALILTLTIAMLAVESSMRAGR